MMKKNLFRYVFIVAVSLYPLSAAAAECDEKSPNYIQQGEKYYDIKEVNDLTREQKIAVKKLFSSIKRKLTGSGSIAVCVARDGSQEKQITTEKYTAGFVMQPDGKITISIHAEKLENKTTYNVIFELFGDDNVFVIKEITGNSMEVFSKRRIPSNRSRGTILHEKIIKISVNKRLLNIKSTRYINGYFAQEYHRTLH